MRPDPIDLTIRSMWDRFDARFWGLRHCHSLRLKNDARTGRIRIGADYPNERVSN